MAAVFQKYPIDHLRFMKGRPSILWVEAIQWVEAILNGGNSSYS